MENRHATRIRALAIGLFLAASPAVARAQAPVHFTAEVDRQQISQDESISLKLSVELEGTHQVDAAPSYNAPDFELVNEYTNSQTYSYLDNGTFGMRNTATYIRVLRPRRAGPLKLDRLEVRVDGRTLQAPSIVVQVSAGGAGTPPPRGYGGTGVGLRGAGKPAPSGAGFFVRAELDKARATKGEQVIVSYYLYRRVRVFNVQVDKYPVLGGFIREDLEMPVLGQRLETEPVVLDGVPYERSLLTRYAAYPLKEGKLPIDSMTVKVNYYQANRGGLNGQDDPFANFFQQMTPLQGVSTSEFVSLEVLPLPEAGRPPSFTGGIGAFEVSTTVDKGQLKAGEALTLTVKVEGKGNFSAIEAPKLSLPAGVELYESRSKVRGGKAGLGEKSFEFVLIPRQAGKVVLSPVEMAFFDPKKGAYVPHSTPAIPLDVLTGEGPALPLSQATRPPDAVALRPWKSAEDALGYRAGPWTERLQALVAFLGLAFAGVLGLRWAGVRWAPGLLGRRKTRSSTAAEQRTWDRLEEQAKATATQGASRKGFGEVVAAYEQLCGAVYDVLDREFQLGARSLPRTELRSILLAKHGVSEPLWDRVAELLEFAERVRFAASAGAVTETEARGSLLRWVQEGRKLDEALIRHSGQRRATVPADEEPQLE